MPGLLTAAEVQRVRTDRAAVNHATYKGILEKLYDRIRHHAAMNHTTLEYSVPGLVPGRPMYDVSHATRYVVEKLRLGGFRVEVADTGALTVDWTPAPPREKRDKPPTNKHHQPKARAPSSAPAPHGAPSAAGLSRRLQILKHKLDL